jgi:ubiquinone biosynthesis protein UbiJ
MAGTAMTLSAGLFSLLENTVNGYIALDPEFPSRLDAVEGGTLRVEIKGMNLDIYIGIARRRVTLRQSLTGDPDAVISGAPLGLLSLLLADDPMVLAQEGLIELRGDTRFARDLKKVFDALDIDWEEKLSGVIGDWPARQLGISAGNFRQWRRRSDDSLHRSIGEYFQEESRLLPARVEIENFVADVDVVREAVDRLEARMDHMKPNGGGP